MLYTRYVLNCRKPLPTKT